MSGAPDRMKLGTLMLLFFLSIYENAFDRPVFVSPLTTEAVRKHGEFLQLAEQSKILRDFFGSERSEGSKKRTK
jgi:hypothetical protein